MKYTDAYGETGGNVHDKYDSRITGGGSAMLVQMLTLRLQVCEVTSLSVFFSLVHEPQ